MIFSFVLVFALLPAMLWMGSDDMTWGFRAYSELTRAREARLLARINGTAASEIDKGESPAACIPKPDFVGHLVLPLVVACAALIDVAFRAGESPLLMPMALALSHARIAVRDWPTRKYYLFGVFATMAMSLISLTEPVRAVDWFAGFLLLFGTASFIEGLLDRRLERGQRKAMDGRHAHTL